MRLFPSELDIDDFQGFTANDIFNRAPFGEALGNIFENVEDPMVAVLDSPWGSGKTTFIKMWCGYMRNQGFPVIYFDAFKNDYADDAFTTLVGEVVELAATLNADTEKTDGFVKSGAKTFVHSLWNGAKATGKHLIKKQIGEEAVDAFVGVLPDDESGEVDNKNVEDALARGIEVSFTSGEAFWAEKVRRRCQEKTELEKFGTALRELSFELGKAAKRDAVGRAKERGEVVNFEEKRRPLIFVIDELDRCRPPFALELLEKIKHLFSVDGVHFLLVTHMKQLENSVKCSYGIEGQESAYLQKFYNIVLHFPQRGQHDKTISEIYLKQIFSELGSNDTDPQILESVCRELAIFSEKHSVQLR